ncbi:hypothetical protein D1872_59460 [compost metagenome]
MRVVYDLPDDMVDMTLDTLHCRPVIHQRIVFKQDRDILVRHDNQVEIVVGLLCKCHIGNREAGLCLGLTGAAHLLHLLPDGVVFKDHDVIDQVLFLFSPCLNVVERECVIDTGGQSLFLCALQYFSKCSIPFTLNPNRYGIDKQSDHVLHAWNVCRTTGYHTTKHNILIIIVLL